MRNFLALLLVFALAVATAPAVYAQDDQPTTEETATDQDATEATDGDATTEGEEAGEDAMASDQAEPEPAEAAPAAIEEEAPQAQSGLQVFRLVVITSLNR